VTSLSLIKVNHKKNRAKTNRKTHEAKDTAANHKSPGSVTPIVRQRDKIAKWFQGNRSEEAVGERCLATATFNPLMSADGVFFDVTTR
jgi:hypothetical protein